MSIKYWLGKTLIPTDPEHLNYTKNAFRDVFEPVFEKGYPSYEAVNKEHLEKIKKGIVDETK